MRIGKRRARFTVRVYDNKSNKTKSFVFDNSIKNVEGLATMIRTLLTAHYVSVSEYSSQHICNKCGIPYGSDNKKDNGRCTKCNYAGGRNKK